jgi:hypothetical protein
MYIGNRRTVFLNAPRTLYCFRYVFQRQDDFCTGHNLAMTGFTLGTTLSLVECLRICPGLVLCDVQLRKIQMCNLNTSWYVNHQECHRKDAFHLVMTHVCCLNNTWFKK